MGALGLDDAAATTRGRKLVAAAEAEAARLVAAAQDLVLEGEQRYADVYGAATAAGWAPADPSALGFQRATASSPRRRRSAAEPPALAPATVTPPTLPEQHTEPEQQAV